MPDITMLVTNAFLPDPRVYKEALSLVRAGYRVRILCWDRGEGLPESETLEGIRISRIRMPSGHGIGARQSFFLIFLWLRMIFRILRDRCDIIHCHDLDTLPAGVILKAVLRKRLVFDSHEVYSRMLGENVPHILKRVARFTEKALIGVPDGVIVTCGAMRRYYAADRHARLTTVSNWKDPEDFEFPENELQKERKHLGIKDETVISYIANLGRDRIIEPLLEAVRDDPGVFLMIGGDGPQRKAIECAAAYSRNIRYLGFVRHDRVPFYTALSDVIYYGYDRDSGMAEFNCPNKLFEALASGRAFLGGDFGEMGRVIREENCGIALSEFDADSIKAALSVFKDKDKLRGFKENAEAAAIKNYNWPAAEKELLSLYSDICRGMRTHAKHG